MGMFSAEGLLQALGVDVAQFTELITQLSTFAAEFTGMKTGMQNGAKHFEARLNKIDADNAEILSLLRAPHTIAALSHSDAENLDAENLNPRMMSDV
jgi:hypothetical protein